MLSTTTNKLKIYCYTHTNKKSYIEIAQWINHWSSDAHAALHQLNTVYRVELTN